MSLVLYMFSYMKWQPTPVFLPGKSHGRRSPVGYSPWGHKESDTTEWLHFSFIISPSNEHSDWFPLRLTGLISLQSKGLSRVFSNTMVQNINWMCLFYENSLSLKLVHLCCMLEFNSFSFYILKSKSWVQSMCFSEGIWFSLFSGVGKIVSIFQMKLTEV